jgi:two-component system nitrogen regulation response regulator GlnG
VHKQALTIDPALIVIIVTGYTDTQRVVQAMRMGAYDYQVKPFNNEEIVQVVMKALAERAVKPKSKICASKFECPPLSEVMGPSDEVARISEDVGRVAQFDFTVMILGETGVGKELVARAIHAASGRANGPFVPVDCGAIPESLFESELWGYDKGAFTGADMRKQGKLEMANSTFFLDEISNMPIDSQAKLLRVLQEKVIYHIGSSTPIIIDVRVLTASNQDFSASIARGDFRQDLFFRLNEFTITIPPLRQRKEDILYLAKRYLDLTNVELHKNVKGFTKAVSDALLEYEWPGNVRQLRSTIRRAVLLADDEITPAHLDIGRPLYLSQIPMAQKVAWDNRPLKEIVQETTIQIERDVLSQVLRLTAGNKAEAARLLRIDYKTIHSKVKHYDIEIKGGNGHGQKKGQRAAF